MCYDLFKDFAGPVATITASMVAVFFTWRLGKGQLAIAKQQAATAQQQANTPLERLNLDLYERRFNVYTAVLDLYQADMRKGLRDIEEAELIFIKAFRESLFLFERQDGIYELLERIKDGHGMILAHKENKESGQSNDLIAKNAGEARINFENLLLSLETKLHKYLDFSKIQ